MLVTNTLDHPVVLHSHCGNSVQVGPKAVRQRVANRFNWQVPNGVLIEQADEPEAIDPCAHVRHRPLVPLRRPPRTAKEARELQAQGLQPHHHVRQRDQARARARNLLRKNAEEDARTAEAAADLQRRASAESTASAAVLGASLNRTADRDARAAADQLRDASGPDGAVPRAADDQA